MIDKNDYKSAKFNNYLNKIISYSSKDYYEKAVSIFERLISLLDRQETDAVFKNIDKKVENIIELATQATGLASGYDWYLSDKWWSCKWNGPDYEDT